MFPIRRVEHVYCLLTNEEYVEDENHVQKNCKTPRSKSIWKYQEARTRKCPMTNGGTVAKRQKSWKHGRTGKFL